MTAPLSQDLRERIAHSVEAGSSARAAAERFAVSPSAAIKLMQRVRQTGSTAPAKIGGHRRPILAPHADTLRAIATSKPGITLKDMRDALHARGIAVKALSTIADMLHRLGLSHKKSMDRPCVARGLRRDLVKWSASIYPASLWSIAPGHHGNPRATGLLRAETLQGHFFAQAAVAPGDRSSIPVALFSRTSAGND
jgi:transposase